MAKRRAEENDARILVVVSALSGVTNELTAIADGAADSAQRVADLEQRHRDFVTELELDADQVLGERLAALRALLSDARAVTRPLDWQAEVLAQGELLSSTPVSYTHLDVYKRQAGGRALPGGKLSAR